MTSSRNGGGSDAPGAMMAEEYDDRYDRASNLDDDEIERRLIEDMEDDDRLQSGPGRRGVDGDVDFVKMSGLTQPDAEAAPWPDAEAEPELPEDADPTAPISFFEEGVDDVDAASDPITAHDRPLPNGDEIVGVSRAPITPERPEPTFLRDLKSIVSDISSAQVGRAPTEPSEPAQSQDDASSDEDRPEERPAAGETAPEWARQLDRAEEQAGSGWERPAYEDLDADMLDWIAQQLESDDDEGDGSPQWDMGGRQYSLETAPEKDTAPVETTDSADDDPPKDEDFTGTVVPPIASLPDEAPPSRPMPPWAEFRRALGDEEFAEDPASASPASSEEDVSSAETCYEPHVWEQSDSPRERDDIAESDASASCIDADAEAEQDAAAIPLPAPALRTRELTRAQALMHSLAPAPDREFAVAPDISGSKRGDDAFDAPAFDATRFDDRTPEQSTIPPMTPVVESRFDAMPGEDSADSAFTPRRRTRHHHRRWLNALLRFFFTLIIIAALGAGAAAGWWWYQRQAESPETAYRRAESRLNTGEYGTASSAFLRFTENFPQSPLKADALFNAAYALQAAPANLKPEAENAYRRSLALFDRFIEQYPGHAKTPRAQTMAAVLYYRLGEYDTAITRLQNNDGRTSDTLTYLPSLRILARSYARLGELDEARSAFLRAASLDTNFTPDQDYLELAALYKSFATETESELKRREYVAQAVEMWNYALRVPGIPAPRRRAIKNYIAAEEQLLDGEPAQVANGEMPRDLQ